MSITYRRLASLSLLSYAASQLLLFVEMTHDREREGQVAVAIIFGIAVAMALATWLVDRWFVPALSLVGAGLGTLGSATYIDHIRYFDRAWEFSPIALLGFGGVTTVIFAAADLVERRRGASGEAPAAVAPAYGVAVAALVTLVAVSFGVGYSTVDRVSAAERQGTTVVKMAEWEFSPSELTAARGERLRLLLENDDLATHTFVLKGGGVSVDEAFAAGDERVVELVFSEAGTFAFACDLPEHSEMEGTVTVR